MRIQRSNPQNPSSSSSTTTTSTSSPNSSSSQNRSEYYDLYWDPVNISPTSGMFTIIVQTTFHQITQPMIIYGIKDPNYTVLRFVPRSDKSCPTQIELADKWTCEVYLEKTQGILIENATFQYIINETTKNEKNKHCFDKNPITLVHWPNITNSTAQPKQATTSSGSKASTSDTEQGRGVFIWQPSNGSSICHESPEILITAKYENPHFKQGDPKSGQKILTAKLDPFRIKMINIPSSKPYFSSPLKISQNESQILNLTHQQLKYDFTVKSSDTKTKFHLGTCTCFLVQGSQPFTCTSAFKVTYNNTATSTTSS